MSKITPIDVIMILIWTLCVRLACHVDTPFLLVSIDSELRRKDKFSRVSNTRNFVWWSIKHSIMMDEGSLLCSIPNKLSLCSLVDENSVISGEKNCDLFYSERTRISASIMTGPWTWNPHCKESKTNHKCTSRESWNFVCSFSKFSMGVEHLEEEH